MPLINNNNLAIEKAWALLAGYAITMGTTIKRDDLIADLEELTLIHEKFDFCEALDELQWLSVINPEVIAEARNCLLHSDV